MTARWRSGASRAGYGRTRSSAASTWWSRTASPRSSGRPGAARPRCCAPSPGSSRPTGRHGHGRRARTVVGAGRPVPPRRRGLGYVPAGGRAVPAPERRRQRRLRAPARPSAGAPPGSPRCSSSSSCPPSWPPATRTSCPAGSSSASRWPGRWRPGRALVLLDEPFSSLDAGLREDTGRSVARALRAAGAAALLVTHDQGEALSLADQVAVMIDGAFLQVDAPATVYLAPLRRARRRVPRPRLAPRRAASRTGAEADLRAGRPAAPRQARAGRGAARRPRRAGPGPAGRRRRGVGRRGRRTSASSATTPPSACGSPRASRSPPARRPARCPRPGDRVSVQVIGDVVAFPGARTSP